MKKQNSKNLPPEEALAKAGALMRVNHTGEVCAQALYLGQALVARSEKLAKQLLIAAKEEESHLNWCAHRLTTLGDRPSYLNPLWAAGAFSLGVIAGLAGDKVSLGFMAETEKQVTAHLDKHLLKLPKEDHISQKILEKMKLDEAKHQQTATDMGGISLPKPVQYGMRFMAKIMTTVAYYF